MAAWTAGCRLRQPSPVDPVALQEAERRGAGDTRYQRLPALPSPDYYLNPRDRDDPRNYDPSPRVHEQVAGGGAAPTGEVGREIPASRPATAPTTRATTQPGEQKVLYLPLQECVRRATMNNFAVAVAGFAPAIAETRVTEALARYDPTFKFSGEYQQQNGTNPAQNVFISSKRLTLSSGVSQLLPSGGNVELQYRALRSDIGQASFFSALPAGVTWTSDLTLQLTQPLLRDFGYDVNRARIFVNQNDHRISILEFRRELEEVLFSVEQTFWQLYRAQQLVEIRSDLLRRTIETAKRIEARKDKDATRAEISQALSETYSREAELIEAKSVAAQLSDQLKSLMNDPDLPIGGEVLVLAGTEPVLEPLLFDLDNAVMVAMLHRPELSQQILRIINAGRVLSVAQSNRLPRLDLLLNGGFSGFDDDYPDAVSQQFEFDNVNVGAGLQLEIPLGNRQARAVLARSRLEREQAVTQYQALLIQVTLEVSQAQREIFSGYSNILKLRQARIASRDAVEQDELLEKSGAPLTPQFSDSRLRRLSLLAQTVSLEAQAIAEYNISLAEYERAKGTLLRYYNVVLEEAAINQRLPIGRNLNQRAPKR